MVGKKARAKAAKAITKASDRPHTVSDFFELRPTPGKGIGAFATRFIAARTNIMVERPLMTLNKPEYAVREADVLQAYKQLSSADKKIFDSARHDSEHGPNCKCKLGVLFGNIFSSSSLDRPSLYPIASRFNHACNPNVIMLSPPKRVSERYHTIRAVRDVDQGEELTFSYLTELEFLTSEERKVSLQGAGFECICAHCSFPAPERLVSDMRRCMLRYLHFWPREKDVGDLEMEPSLNVLNSKADARLLSNGVYSLLYAILMEAEGIVTGPDAHLAYALTAWHVLNVAHHEKLDRIPATAVQDIRLWMKKSEANIRLQYGDNLDKGGDMWVNIKAATSSKCVQDDGQLVCKALRGLARVAMMKGMSLFSAVPP
ncbi:Putative SET domain-containing protein [Septoria linicola]|uniref:SET domain-containing protein n=1 Tax=Septoria linicola TaxID=215465 RepID=A0A9Q9AZY6_9PEZI|nr:Putative SET domain-containing protein [Septoria linicola]